MYVFKLYILNLSCQTNQKRTKHFITFFIDAYHDIPIPFKQVLDSMAVGTWEGGGSEGGGAIPPPIFCQPNKIKSLKITIYKSVYSNKGKICF